MDEELEEQQIEEQEHPSMDDIDLEYFTGTPADSLQTEELRQRAADRAWVRRLRLQLDPNYYLNLAAEYSNKLIQDEINRKIQARVDAIDTFRRNGPVFLAADRRLAPVALAWAAMNAGYDAFRDPSHVASDLYEPLTALGLGEAIGLAGDKLIIPAAKAGFNRFAGTEFGQAVINGGKAAFNWAKEHPYKATMTAINPVLAIISPAARYLLKRFVGPVVWRATGLYDRVAANPIVELMGRLSTKAEEATIGRFHNWADKGLLEHVTAKITKWGERTPTPATVQPATTQPATVQPATTQPATTQPATVQPATTQPATTQPATTQPATTQPATTQPATVQPATTQHTVTFTKGPDGSKVMTITSTAPSELQRLEDFYLYLMGTNLPANINEQDAAELNQLIKNFYNSFSLNDAIALENKLCDVGIKDYELIDAFYNEISLKALNDPLLLDRFRHREYKAYSDRPASGTSLKLQINRLNATKEYLQEKEKKLQLLIDKGASLLQLEVIRDEIDLLSRTIKSIEKGIKKDTNGRYFGNFNEFNPENANVNVIFGILRPGDIIYEGNMSKMSYPWYLDYLLRQAKLGKTHEINVHNIGYLNNCALNAHIEPNNRNSPTFDYIWGHHTLPNGKQTIKKTKVIRDKTTGKKQIIQPNGTELTDQEFIDEVINPKIDEINKVTGSNIPHAIIDGNGHIKVPYLDIIMKNGGKLLPLNKFVTMFNRQ